MLLATLIFYLWETWYNWFPSSPNISSYSVKLNHQNIAPILVMILQISLFLIDYLTEPSPILLIYQLIPFHFYKFPVAWLPTAQEKLFFMQLQCNIQCFDHVFLKAEIILNFLFHISSGNVVMDHANSLHSWVHASPPISIVFHLQLYTVCNSLRVDWQRHHVHEGLISSLQWPAFIWLLNLSWSGMLNGKSAVALRTWLISWASSMSLIGI